MLDGGGEVVLFEGERAEIVAGRTEIDVEAQGLFVSALCLFGMTGAVMGEAEMVPGLRITRQKFGCLFELFDGRVEIALVDQVFAFEQCAGARRAATCEEEQGR